MTVLHLCRGLDPTNGAANLARLIAAEQRAAGHTVDLRTTPSREAIAACDELWCHCGWYWRLWLAVACAKRLGKTVRWVPSGCYNPTHLAYHARRKRLVAPFERGALRRCDELLATCAAEAGWIRAYVGRVCPPVTVTDVRRFFALPASPPALPPRDGRPLHVLYLGRPHPMKGTAFLAEAVRAINASAGRPLVDLHLVSDKTGDALEAEWAWADLLCLPTLADCFGLVVAEALARGKPALTTDGAPAWEGQPGVTFLTGYVAGSPARRVALLRTAIERFL